MFKQLVLITTLLSASLIEARVNDLFAEEKAENQRYTTTILDFMAQSKEMTELVHKAYAHAVFPTVWKGGLVLGYASGEGRVFFRGGIWRANVQMTQYTAGLQVGGSAYSEIIFFTTREAFLRFKKGEFEDSTQTSLVPFYSGLSYDVDFDDGVQVYTSSKGGFMLEATSGIQSFEYINRPY